MKWLRDLWRWVRLSLLEGRLQRRGYRRLHEIQVTEATERSKRVIYDLADAVIALRTIAEQVEAALDEMRDEEDWRDG